MTGTDAVNAALATLRLARRSSTAARRSPSCCAAPSSTGARSRRSPRPAASRACDRQRRRARAGRDRARLRGLPAPPGGRRRAARARRRRAAFPTTLDYRDDPRAVERGVEKLEAIRPRSVGQASRISGVTPAAIAILLTHIGLVERRKAEVAFAASMKLRALMVVSRLLVAAAAAAPRGRAVPARLRRGLDVARRRGGRLRRRRRGALASTRRASRRPRAPRSRSRRRSSSTRWSSSARGTYDALADRGRSRTRASAYATVENDPDLPLGIGTYPAGAGDRGRHRSRRRGAEPAPRASASTRRTRIRSATCARRRAAAQVRFNGDFDAAPPPTRYDIIEQEAAVRPAVDRGGVLDHAAARRRRAVLVPASPTSSRPSRCGAIPATTRRTSSRTRVLTVDAARTTSSRRSASASTYRPTPNIELGGELQLDGAAVHAKGTAIERDRAGRRRAQRPARRSSPVDDVRAALRARRHDRDADQGCVELAAADERARSAAATSSSTASGALKGDVELNVGWENWGKRCDCHRGFAGLHEPRPVPRRRRRRSRTSTASADDASLKDNVIDHGFQDTFGAPARRQLPRPGRRRTSRDDHRARRRRLRHRAPPRTAGCARTSTAPRAHHHGGARLPDEALRGQRRRRRDPRGQEHQRGHLQPDRRRMASSAAAATARRTRSTSARPRSDQPDGRADAAGGEPGQPGHVSNRATSCSWLGFSTWF